MYPGFLEGAISCLATNAFTKRSPTPNHVFLFFTMAMANYFWPKGAMTEWPRASFQLFLGGSKFFFQCHRSPGLLKNWKKQHFICSNSTLFIVLFFLFFPFFSLFFFFFLFFFLSFSFGGDSPPCSPPQMTPLSLAPLLKNTPLHSQRW